MKLNLLITAGPTREYIDSVRFLSNGSSGRMGYACAAAGIRRGHRVRLISGPVALETPKGTSVTRVTSAEEMAQAVQELFDWCDAVIMTAAVADYRPTRPLAYKMTKSSGPLTLQLERTGDILAELGRRKADQVLIGFAMQDRAARRNARRKLREKNLDAIILNHPSAMGSTRNSIEILRADCRGQWLEYADQTKAQLARRIVALAETLCHNRISGAAR